jgi:immunoglobulin-binding protein 1
MAIHYHLAVLVQRITGGDRLSYLQRALKEYDQFLRLLDTYDALSKAESQLYEQFRSDPKNFSTAPVNDAARRREIKITRFKAEKELKQKLQVRSS